MPPQSGIGFEQLRLRTHRAAGRAIVSIGVKVATETKLVTDVITGNLRRSVHVAPVGYDGSSDEGLAPSGDLLDLEVTPTQTAVGPSVEVGSWLPYACVEWVGRSHPGINQGLEAARGKYADAAVARAFLEEGLV